MKIVIAPDSFKESLTAMEVAELIEKGFRTRLPHAQYTKIPVADGGEGTVQSMVDATDGEIIELQVMGPLGTPVDAYYGILGKGDSANIQGRDNHCDTAIIEMAAASGLHHVPVDKRNPCITTSYGTGELIIDALNRGIKRILIGLGGSATNDGGAGMAQALGAKLLDKDNLSIAAGGAALETLDLIKLDTIHPLLSQCEFIVACDVDNPLCGPNGASHVFGPQKGATPEMIQRLDSSLNHFANIIEQTQELSIENNLSLIAGSGAAGGMGLGVMAFLNAKLEPGIDIVMNTVKLAQQLQGADLVITGEGKLDSQTLHGKTPMGVAQLAKQQGIKVIAIAGCVSEDANVLLEHGIDALFSITPRALPIEQVLQDAKHNLLTTSQNIAALIALRV